MIILLILASDYLLRQYETTTNACNAPQGEEEAQESLWLSGLSPRVWIVVTQIVTTFSRGLVAQFLHNNFDKARQRSDNSFNSSARLRREGLWTVREAYDLLYWAKSHFPEVQLIPDTKLTKVKVYATKHRSRRQANLWKWTKDFRKEEVRLFGDLW